MKAIILLLLACLLAFAGCSSAASAAAILTPNPPGPSGLIAIDDSHGFTNVSMNGMHKTLKWSENLQPSAPGAINFSGIDSLISQAQAANKQLILSLDLLAWPPAWLLATSGVQSYTYSGGTIVTAWDPVVQPYLLDLIQQVCAHVNGVSGVAGVIIGGVGFQTETGFPGYCSTTPALKDASGATITDLTTEIALWTATSNTIVDAYATNLPDTPMLFAVIVPFQDCGGDSTIGQAAIGGVLDRADGLYGSRIGYMSWSLNTTSSPTAYQNARTSSKSPYHPAGYQFVGSTSGTGGTIHGGPLDVIATGASAPFSARFIEVYPVDTNRPDQGDWTSSDYVPLAAFYNNLMGMNHPDPAARALASRKAK